MKILLKNGHVIDPTTGRDEVTDIMIVDGIIEKMKTTRGVGASVEEYDLKGSVVAPGFIDMHIHAREPGFEHKETLATAVASAVAGGFTAVCCMPNTNPAVDDAPVVEFIKKKASEIVPALVDVYVIGAITKGREGKELAPMRELARAGAVGFSDDGSPVANAEIMRRALEYAGSLQKPVIQHAEESSMTRGGAMNEGIVGTRLGLPGIPAAAEELMIERDVRLVEYVAAAIPAEEGKPRYHAAHISTTGSVEIVREAKRKKLSVTCEVTPHHFTLTDEEVTTFDTNTKMNPPLRTRDDVEALKEGLRDGTIDAIATDHAPHSFDEKQVEFINAPFGIVGLETAIGLAVTELVEPGILTLPELIQKFTSNPRMILGLSPVSISEGSIAVLTIFDPKKEWIVDTGAFRSKSKNSPFHGRRLRGRAVAIVNRGSIHFS
jgi:dihydroorotase